MSKDITESVVLQHQVTLQTPPSDVLLLCGHCQAIYIEMRTVLAHLLVHTATGGSQNRAKKTLAKHPRENSELYGKQLVFFPYLTSNCLSKYDGGGDVKEDRDSSLQKALHRHPETTATLRKTVSLLQGTQNISL